MFRRTGRVGLMTVALVIVPLGGLFLLLYGAGLLAVRKRRAASPDPYEEWLTLRDLMRSRGTKSAADSASSLPPWERP